MANVKDILSEKGSQVWSVRPETPVRATLELMAEKEIGAVVVVVDQRIVGVFSERDCIRRVAETRDPGMSVPVQNLMSSPVYCVAPETPVDECMALMSDRQIRHLPVVENDQLVGLVSIGDVVKWAIREKDGAIRDLENYIWLHMI